MKSIEFPQFALGYDNFGAALKCRYCGEECLHQIKTEVFERNGQDDTKGYHVTVSSKNIEIDNSLTDNPSSRRDGLLIHFYCEIGCVNSCLEIFQHKCSTFFKWS